MKDVYKCAYSKCILGGIVNIDECVTEGNKHYHPECLKDKKNRIEIKNLFLNNINRLETIQVLIKVINTIVDTKNVSSDFLLYALKYVIEHKLNLNHAQGLYHIINYDQIKKSYIEKKTNQTVQININKTKTKEEVTFKINSNNNLKWNKILE